MKAGKVDGGPGSASERSYALDAVRFAATICIALLHYQQNIVIFLHNEDLVFEGLKFADAKFNFSYLVELFFIISGFLAYKYADGIRRGLGFWSFWGRRWMRLMPVVIATVFVHKLIEILISVHKGEAWYASVSLWKLLLTSLGVHDSWGLGSATVNSPTWYISVLLLCYALLYAMVFAASRGSFSEDALFVAAIFAGVMLRNANIVLRLARGLHTFFLGLLLGKYRRPLVRIARWKYASVIGAVTLLYALAYPVVAEGFHYILSFLVYPSALMLAESRAARRLFSCRLFGFLGAISYDIYVWHAVCLRAIWLCVYKGIIPREDLTRLPMMCVFLMITLCVAVVSRCAIEKPIERSRSYR